MQFFQILWNHQVSPTRLVALRSTKVLGITAMEHGNLKTKQMLPLNTLSMQQILHLRLI